MQPIVEMSSLDLGYNWIDIVQCTSYVRVFNQGTNTYKTASKYASYDFISVV